MHVVLPATTGPVDRLRLNLRAEIAAVVGIDAALADLKYRQAMALSIAAKHEEGSTRQAVLEVAAVGLHGLILATEAYDGSGRHEPANRNGSSATIADGETVNPYSGADFNSS